MRNIQPINTHRYSTKQNIDSGAMTWTQLTSATGINKTISTGQTTGIALWYSYTTLSNPVSFISQPIQLQFVGSRNAISPVPTLFLTATMRGWLYFKNTANPSPTPSYFKQEPFSLKARFQNQGVNTQWTGKIGDKRTFKFTQGLKVNNNGSQKIQLWARVTYFSRTRFSITRLEFNAAGAANAAHRANTGRIEDNKRFFNL